MSIDDKEFNAVAYLVTQQATRMNRGWESQGIYALVRQAIEVDGRAPLDVAAAARRALDDPTAKTPAALRWGKYYQDPTSPAATPTEPDGPLCYHCSKPATIHERICERDPHEWEPFPIDSPKRPLPEWRELVR